MSRSPITPHNKRLMQPLFLVPTKAELDLVAKLDAELAADQKVYREAAQKRAAFAVESNSLVKSCKSPTKPKPRNFTELYEQQAAIVREKNQKRRETKAKERFAESARTNRKNASIRAAIHTTPEPISLESRKTYSLGHYLSSSELPGYIEKPVPVIAGVDKSTGELKSTIETAPNCIVRMYNQSWSGKYRFGFETNALGAKVAPPETSGERTTDELTRNATKAILESGAYMATTRSGYTTFLTLTFDEEAREKLKAEETTIGKEVSRFFDGAQKIYQRGMRIEPHTEEINGHERTVSHVFFAPAMVCPELVYPRLLDGELKEIPEANELVRYNFRKHTESDYAEQGVFFGKKCVGAPLDYMWVAEMPKNSDGEDNPHVHVLMRWQVEPQYFQQWAKRLEKLWGHGFAKLERIHSPQAASNYLLKAVGYMTKGAEGEQGKIKGNRYNISASARAPRWECIGEFYADNFLAILGELREKLHRRKATIRGAKTAILNAQAETKAEIAKQTNINKKSFSENRMDYIEKLKDQLSFNDESVDKLNKQLGELPYINDFAIGGLDEDKATNFLHWAMRERWWNAEVRETRYSQWNELKQATIEAVKQARSYYRESQWLCETRELTWQWALNDSKYDIETTHQNVVLDEYGNEWELVA